MIYKNLFEYNKNNIKVFIFKSIRLFIIFNHISIYLFANLVYFPFLNFTTFPLYLFRFFSSYVLNPISSFVFRFPFIKFLPGFGFDIRLYFVNYIFIPLIRFSKFIYSINKIKKNNTYRNTIIL